MKRGFLKNLLALIVVFGSMTACNLEYFQDAGFGDFVWDPSLAIPVGEITYSIEELFEELNDAGAQIGTNEENIVTLSYTETLQSQSASAFLAVLDQSFSGSVQSGVNISNPGISTTIDVNETFEFDIVQRGAEQYDSILFSGGDFEIQLTSEINAEIDFTMRILSLENKNTENPLTITGTLSPSNPTAIRTRDLGNFDGLFHQDADGDPSTNKVVIEMQYSMAIEPTTIINATDKLRFDITMTDAQFETVYGDIGTTNLDVNFQVVNLDFFRNFDATGIRFAEPKFSFVFENGFGFPLGLDFRSISSIGSEGQIVPLSGTAIDDPTIVEAPTKDNVGDVIVSSLELNSSNSNIDEMLAVQPRKVIMEVNAESNPASIPSQYNFVDINSLLDVSVEVEIPLIMNVDNLVAEETVAFSDGADLQEAKRLMFRVIAENELPLGGDIEIEFLDDQGNVVHTVAERPVFTGAPVGPDDRTTEATVTTADVELSDQEIRAIENAVTIRVLARLSTTDATSGDAVKFFSDYELRVKLAAQADIEVGTSGN